MSAAILSSGISSPPPKLANQRPRGALFMHVLAAGAQPEVRTAGACSVVRLAHPAAAVSQLEAAVAGRLQRRNAWQIIWPRPYRDMAYRVFEQLPI